MATLTIPGGLPQQGWMLTLAPGQALDGVAWPAKGAGSSLPRAVDLTAYLADLGLTVGGAIGLEASPSLTVSMLSGSTDPVVKLLIGGGAPAETVRVRLTVPLSQGADLELVVSMPIYDDGAAGLVPVPPVPANDPLPALIAAIL